MCARGVGGIFAKRAQVISAQSIMSHSVDCIFTYHTQYTNLL